MQCEIKTRTENLNWNQRGEKEEEITYDANNVTS
jgi:hypothetical protein